MASPELKVRAELPDHAPPYPRGRRRDRRVRELLSRYLYEQGFRRPPPPAMSRRPRQRAQSFVFDALVLDVMMPGENGFDYARQVRETSRVPILMLTARFQPQTTG